MNLEKENLNILEPTIEDSPKEIFQSTDLFENLEFYKEHIDDYENKNDSLARTIVMLTSIGFMFTFILPIYSINTFAGVLSSVISSSALLCYWELLKEKLNNKPMQSILQFAVRPLVHKKNVAQERCKVKGEDIEADLAQNKTKVMFAKLYQHFSQEKVNNKIQHKMIDSYLTNIIHDYSVNNIDGVLKNSLMISHLLKDYCAQENFKKNTDSLADLIIRNETDKQSLSKNIFKKSKNYQI